MALALPASAQAASLHLPDRVEATVEQGGSAAFAIPVTAGGAITCRSVALVAIDSLYSVDAAGDVASGLPVPVEFRGAATKGNGGNCDVTWDGAPDAYALGATATAASTTPLGDYETRVAYVVTNTGGSGPSGKLGKAGVATVAIHVVPPTPVIEQAPAALPEPAQLVLGVRKVPLRPSLGKTELLTLVKGKIRYRTPGGKGVTLVEQAVVPNGTVVDATGGVVKVTVERDSTGALDSVDAWGGGFKMRQESRGQHVTTITLSGGVAQSRAASVSRVAKKRRSLWMNGKGNFKTRGKRASAIVRGTYWLTQETARGTKVTVKRGLVSVRDFVARRDVLLRAGQSYLARPRVTQARRAPAFTGSLR